MLQARAKRIRVQLISVFLLAIFLQKMGLELWVHDEFHVGKSNNTATEKVKINCCCLDDVFTPMSPSSAIEVPVVVMVFIHPTYEFTEYFISAEKDFHSLRGPPRAA